MRIQVTSCINCPFRHVEMDESICRNQSAEGLDIIDFDKIPDACPLRKEQVLITIETLNPVKIFDNA